MCPELDLPTTAYRPEVVALRAALDREREMQSRIEKLKADWKEDVDEWRQHVAQAEAAERERDALLAERTTTEAEAFTAGLQMRVDTETRKWRVADPHGPAVYAPWSQESVDAALAAYHQQKGRVK